MDRVRVGAALLPDDEYLETVVACNNLSWDRMPGKDDLANVVPGATSITLVALKADGTRRHYVVLGSEERGFDLFQTHEEPLGR